MFWNHIAKGEYRCKNFMNRHDVQRMSSLQVNICVHLHGAWHQSRAPSGLD